MSKHKAVCGTHLRAKHADVADAGARVQLCASAHGEVGAAVGALHAEVSLRSAVGVTRGSRSPQHSRHAHLHARAADVSVEDERVVADLNIFSICSRVT